MSSKPTNPNPELGASSKASEDAPPLVVDRLDSDPTIKTLQISNDGTTEAGGDAAVTDSAEKKPWGSKLAYMLTLVGFAVGFGNLWRFPYMVRDNGGVVFLIPYFFMAIFLGFPVFFLEISVGQRRRKGLIQCWNEISPAFGGIGLCSAAVCFMCGLYYTSLLAYSLSYMFDSFRNPLPWSSCDDIGSNKAEQAECKANLHDKTTKYYWFRKTLNSSPGIDDPGGYDWYLALYHLLAWAINYGILIRGSTETAASVTYFTAVFPYFVLIMFFVANWVHEPAKVLRGTYYFLRPEWSFLWKPKTWFKAGSQIFFSMAVACCLVVFSSHNPARYDCYKDSVTVGVINSCTSLFAGMVVFPMMGRLGHNNYDKCKAQMEKLIPGLKLWKIDDEYYDIYMIADYSKKWNEISPNDPITVGYGYGGWSFDGVQPLTTRKNANGYEWKFETVDSPQSGNPSDPNGLLKDILRNCSIEGEAKASGGGTGFVFLGFTQAVLLMDGSNFWSFLFFIMLFTLGIDSGFGTIEGCIVAVEELLKLKRWISTTLVLGLMTFISMLLFPWGWGIYVLDVIDQWSLNWSLLVIGGAELIAVSWSYGLAKFAYDVKLMTGRKPNGFIMICWRFISPAIVFILLVFSIVDYIMEEVKGGSMYTTFDIKRASKDDAGDHKKHLPWYTLMTGLILCLLVVVWLPLQAILRNTKWSLLKPEPESEFPEEELREERFIHVEKEADQFTNAEKIIIGSRSLTSLQKYRDEKTRAKQEGKPQPNPDSAESIATLK